jgi:hypothetical protein
MKRSGVVATAILALAVRTAGANEAPEIEHQPSTCTVAGQAISLCASISDDNQVARARVYFRRPGEKFYMYAEMSFAGLGYCATLPAPLEGKIEKVEYYIQAIDNEYETRRTSTYSFDVKAEGQCDFPPIEKDAARKSAIKVFATSIEQGIKLPKGFDPAGVTFSPVTTGKK